MFVLSMFFLIAKAEHVKILFSLFSPSMQRKSMQQLSVTQEVVTSTKFNRFVIVRAHTGFCSKYIHFQVCKNSFPFIQITAFHHHFCSLAAIMLKTLIQYKIIHQSSSSTLHTCSNLPSLIVFQPFYHYLHLLT
mmetsp:Transcript_7113/g.15477  ORF Transcript_7113/g.15477 Transcript_7113/m.15477 type:complete len:134 (+) Transcript_7113:982-1383(+)